MSWLHKKRITLLVSLLLGLSLSLGLVLLALSKNINLFYTPTQLHQEKVKLNRTLRVGGMVVNNSVIRHADMTVEFVITDFAQELNIRYTGILPDLFREGQGVVAEGMLDPQGQFIASQVLAKHDEKYMPPEVAAGLQLTAKSMIEK